ncbi:MAG: hypothetical protein WKG07_07905 [Hymenobacter sp.]
MTYRTGLDFAQGGDGRERDNYALHYQSRTIYSGQLGGTHDLGAAKDVTVTWNTGYNYVFRNEPDYRRFRTGRDVPPTRPGCRPVSGGSEPGGARSRDNSIYYSQLKEGTYMGSGQLEKRLAGRDSTRANQYKLRAGFYVEYKDRNYDSRYFSYVPGRSSTFDQKLLSLPIEQIFQPQNVNPNTGFVLQEGTNSEDRYHANNTLAAAYLSAVAPISDKFNLSGGVRMEYNRKFLRSGNESIPAYEEKKVYFLPSLNATYNFDRAQPAAPGGRRNAEPAGVPGNRGVLATSILITTRSFLATATCARPKSTTATCATSSTPRARSYSRWACSISISPMPLSR